MLEELKPRHPGIRQKLYEIIFESDTKAGKAFDVILILAICVSVLAILFDSVESYRLEYGLFFFRLEWILTFIFTAEYVVRLLCVRHPITYARSFFGVVDLLAILPSYFSLFLPGSHYLIVIRILRVLRVFRILRLVQYVGEANLLMQAMRASRRKILVFLFAVLTSVVVLGSLMYLVEGSENGYTSIPQSIYWTIVTLTTVGYGDITPKTPLGQFLASIIMILGYGIIAVPTGIVTAEMTRSINSPQNSGESKPCPHCQKTLLQQQANFCSHCGYSLLETV